MAIETTLITYGASFNSNADKIPPSTNTLDLIARNHSLTRSEVEFLFRHCSTCEGIKTLIEGRFLPLLAEAVDAVKEPGSQEFFDAFQIERHLHAFFTCSALFPWAAKQYLETTISAGTRAQLRRVVGSITMWNELTSSPFIREILSDLPIDQRGSFLKRMTAPYTDFRNQLLNMERIPQIPAELECGGINESSNVLMIGCGALPLSGIAYALAGAQVTIVDRAAEAFETAEPLLSLLPKEVRSRIHTLTIDARNFIDLPSATHLLVAGLTEGKENLLRLAREQSREFTVLLRRPPQNLLQLYYFPVEEAELNGFEVKTIVDIGIEGYNHTAVLHPLRG